MQSADALEENFYISDQEQEAIVDVSAEEEAEVKPVTKTKNKKKRKKKQTVIQQTFLATAQEQLDFYHSTLLNAFSSALTLSSLELEEFALPMECFPSIEAVADRSIASFPVVIKHMIQHKTFVCNDQTGAPNVLIITAAALRASHIAKECYSLKCKVVKLFAKHIKPTEQIQQLSNIVHVGVGTPARMLQLIDQGHLSTQSLDLIIIDGLVDHKNRVLWQMQDTCKPLAQLIRQLIPSKPRLIVF